MGSLKPAPVSTRQFMYNAATRTFVGEISDTAGRGRVYPDSCDDGLTLVSASTGKEIVFVVDRVAYNSEGELLYWTLRSLSSDPYSMTLFND